MFIEITHQQWIRDYAVETGRETVLGGEQTCAILDAESVQTIRDFMAYGDGDFSSDFGDNLAYSAQDAGWAEIDGPFYVRLQLLEDTNLNEALERYLADRAKRGVPEDGDDSGITTSGLAEKVKAINDLIASLPKPASDLPLYFAEDGSWGAVQDLTIRLESDLSPEERSEWQMLD